jgi:hypothetical protein
MANLSKFLHLVTLGRVGRCWVVCDGFFLTLSRFQVASVAFAEFLNAAACETSYRIEAPHHDYLLSASIGASASFCKGYPESSLVDMQGEPIITRHHDQRARQIQPLLVLFETLRKLVLTNHSGIRSSPSSVRSHSRSLQSISGLQEQKEALQRPTRLAPLRSVVLLFIQRFRLSALTRNFRILSAHSP